jgi:hypothetical protein
MLFDAVRVGIKARCACVGGEDAGRVAGCEAVYLGRSRATGSRLTAEE